MLLIALVIVACLILLALGFVAPRFSHKPQGKADKELSKGEGKSNKLPGFLGRMMPKSFSFSRKAVDKSTEEGRKGRRKA
jgi:hypothetical protein